MSEQLHRSLGFQSLFDAIECQRRNTCRQLRFCDTWLNTKHLRKHVSRPDFGRRHIVEPHIAKTIESPGFHWVAYR
jgi:hypothetical protein